MIKKLIYSLVILLVLAGTVFGAGLTPNLMNEDCNDITSWTDDDTSDAVSSVSPAGWFKFLTVTAGGYAGRSKTITTPPANFTVEIKITLTAGGTNTDRATFAYGSSTWRLAARWHTSGMFITNSSGVGTEVGTDIVTIPSTVVWRIQVTNQNTCEVFKDGTSQGSGIDCAYATGMPSDGGVSYYQFGATAGRESSVDYIRIASGLGAISDTSNPIVNIF
jgi:hypothetical protein